MRKLSVALLGASVLLSISGCAHKTPATAPMQPMALIVPEMAVHHTCTSVDGLPDPTCTPGAARTTDVNSICNGGSTKQWRPTTSVTNPLKKQGIIDYGYTDTNMADYEEDHLISLELGGDGSDPKNLWPEPHTGQYNSFVKDQVENWLHAQVCKTKTMTPKEAQDGIAKDWRQYIPQVLASRNKTTEVQ